jgi:hypothetical protein
MEESAARRYSALTSLTSRTYPSQVRGPSARAHRSPCRSHPLIRTTSFIPPHSYHLIHSYDGHLRAATSAGVRRAAIVGFATATLNAATFYMIASGVRGSPSTCSLDLWLDLWLALAGPLTSIPRSLAAPLTSIPRPLAALSHRSLDLWLALSPAARRRLARRSLIGAWIEPRLHLAYPLTHSPTHPLTGLTDGRTV